MAHHIPGDSVEISTVFSQPAANPEDPDVPIDPDQVKYTIVDPIGGRLELVYGVDVEVIRQNVGSYLVYQALDIAGEWRVRFEGFGSLQSAEETTIRVYPSIIA